MRQLEALAREAVALGNGKPPLAVDAPLSAHEAEVARQMRICNACRYCEGFCAVFPAMTRRLAFGRDDIHYLANLCHNCGACLHACQYAPPHEFAVNVPQALARVRVDTYAHYAWPPALGGLYRRNGLALSLALAVSLALFLALAAGRGRAAGSDFYGVFPHGLMVSLFLPVFAFAALALAMGVARFWRAQSPGELPGAASTPAVAEAAHDALRLKYLDGGHGQGCNNADDAFTLWRRRFHHLTFYGFALCFAATSVGTLYHYGLALPAPYGGLGWTALPKLLGITGGIGLLLGPAGLAWLHLRRHPAQGDRAQRPMDLGFIALLFFTSASGLALMLARGTPALPTLLALHLGFVMALFLTLPYGKFAHAVYRCAALLKYAIERRQPNRLQLGAD